MTTLDKAVQRDNALISARKLKKENPTKWLASQVQAAGITLYQDEYYRTPKERAKKALNGKTHYLDDATIKHFGSRVASARVQNLGLSYLIIESSYTSFDKLERRFRAIEFDVFGNVINDTRRKYTSAREAEKAYFNTQSQSITEYYKKAFKEKSERALRDVKLFKSLAK